MVMEHREPEVDPVEASYAFDKRLQSAPSYKKMGTKLRRRTYFGLILATSVALNVSLSLTAINAASNADSALTQQHTTCLAGNEFRKEDHQRWLFVENLIAPKPRSAQTQHKVDLFETYINKTDSLRNCNTNK